jgi:subtilase family serine protease
MVRKTSWGGRWAAPPCALALLALLALVPARPPAALAAGTRPRGARLGAAPPAQQLPIVLPLTANLAGLERFATAVTTVGSPQYGEYEPVATLASRFGADAAARTRVIHYLRRRGATRVRIDATGLFADATMSVSVAQRLFGTSLGRFAGARATRYVAPTTTARVPAALSGAVTGVVGLNTRPVFVAPQSTIAGSAHYPRTAARFGSAETPSGSLTRSGTPEGCPAALLQRGFTPNQYLSAYNYTPLHNAGITGAGERVALIEIDGFRYSDVRAFASCFGFGVPAINGYGVGLRHPLPPGGETTLDLEVLDAAAPGLKEVDVYESSARASDVLQSLTAPLQTRGHVPEVISASLGTCEPALMLSIGESGIHSTEGALAMAAASGISVLASSGDAGSTACVAKSGPLDSLAVSFPASSPFVTGVGGTNVTLNHDNQIIRQPVWNDAPYDLTAGGGGASMLFDRPSYQKGLVRRDRRGVPDVSMLADVEPGYDIYCTAQGECLNVENSNPWVPVGGTSAASPLFAGGLALVDQLLRQHGKQNVGLANSLLYKLDRRDASTGLISDVVSNDNDLGPYLSIGNHRSLGCCTARPGYDLASGLGSVNVGKLAFLAASVQPAVAKVSLRLPAQRPLARRHLLAKLSCSRRCIVGAAALVAIPGAGSFRLFSSTHLLLRKGGRTLQLRFSRSELRRLHAGVRGHKKIYASVIGEVLDAGGNVERLSRIHRLRIAH